MSDFKNNDIKISTLTPPESPKIEEARISFPKDYDNDTLELIGSTKFEPRGDIKNILVTGGAGFIGSWVTRHLTVQYPHYNIVCIDKLDYVSTLANIDCLKSLLNFAFIQGDITDPATVRRVLSEHNIDCIMHFAACSHVQNSFHDQNSFTLNNVIGTQVLLEEARQQGNIRRFIHVSTDEVYGEAHEDSVDETKQFLPTNPYSASKAAAEMYVYAYYKSFNIPVVIVRSNNVYGPCQYPESKSFSVLSYSVVLLLTATFRNHS
jgi:dTDP-glucose 4,6-dehydratase